MASSRPGTPSSAANLASSASGSVEEALPYRLEVRKRSWEEVERANRAERLKGANAYKHPEEEERRIFHAGTARREHLVSWIHHPDERVPIELARKCEAEAERPWAPLADVKMQGFFAEVALARAGEEGLLWTPLLDALSVSTLQATAPVRREGNESVPLRYELGRRLDALEAWVEKQEDLGRVMPLLSFQAAEVHHLVARSIRSPGEAEWRRLAGARELLPFLAENTELPKSRLRWLEDWAGGEICGTRWPRQLESPPERRRGLRSSRQEEPVAAEVLERLLKGGWELHPEAWEALLARVEPWQPPTEPKAPFYRKSPPDAGSPTHSRAQAWSLLSSPRAPLPEPLFEPLFERVRHERERVEWLLQHPRAPLGLIRRVAREVSDPRVREQLSSRPEYRRDPEIRQELEKSSAAKVLRALLDDVEGEEKVRLFRRLFRASETMALTFALERVGGRLERLEPVLRDILDEARDASVLAVLCEGAEGARLRTLFARLVALSPELALTESLRHPRHLDVLAEEDVAGTLSVKRPTESFEESGRRRDGLRLYLRWAMGHKPGEAIRIFVQAEGEDLQGCAAADFHPLHASSSPEARGEGYGALFRKLVEVDAALALEFLAEAPEDKLPSLRALDLAPLLASPEAELRTRAIRSLRPGMAGGVSFGRSRGRR